MTQRSAICLHALCHERYIENDANDQSPKMHCADQRSRGETLTECQKLSQIRENVQSFQGITMNRSLGAVEFIIGANRKEELLLHRIYSARVQAELHAGTGSCV